MKQNLTISLERDVIKKAKILAAHQDTSITGLVTAYIEKIASQDDQYQASRAKALKAMEKGYSFGNKKTPRASLHER